MIYNAVLSVVCLLLCIGTASSAVAGWSAVGSPANFHVNSAPKRVYLAGLPVTDTACTNTTPVVLIDPSTPQANDAGKELYATLLAAVLAGKQVRVYGQECWQEYSTPIVTAVEVFP